jgi:hypothetical protein
MFSQGVVFSKEVSKKDISQVQWTYWLSPSLLSASCCPYGALQKKCSVSRASHYMSLGILSIGALSPGFPHEARSNREMLNFQSLPWQISRSFQSPSKGSLPPVSPRSHREGDGPYPEPFFICLSNFPVNEPSPLSRFPISVPMDRAARLQRHASMAGNVRTPY